MKNQSSNDFLDVHFSGDEDEIQECVQHKNLKISVSDISGKKGHTELRKDLLTNTSNAQSLEKTSLATAKKKHSEPNALRKPLFKGEHEKIRRLICYDKAVKVTSKWNKVVQENRKAKQIKFPLTQSDAATVVKTTEFHKDKKPYTKMEEEVAKLLARNKDKVSDRRPLSQFEEKALQAMSLKEAQERRTELLKQKALLSYYGAKMKRQGKIKSKKYHRILKKERLRQEQKKVDVLKDTDPEAYQKWLRDEEKKRIEERMTLKHKGGSRNMKKEVKYGKYNPESRQAIQDMKEKGRELTTRNDFSSDDDNNDDDNDDNNDDDDEIENVENDLYEDLDDAGVVEEEESVRSRKRGRDQEDERLVKKPKTDHSSDVSINALGHLKIENVINPDGSDANRSSKKLKEALEETHVIKEFNEEKKALENRDKNKNIDMVFPGWQEWTGKGLSVSRKKRKRFTIKVPVIPRKDSSMENVIISELKDEAISKHQVSSLPWNCSNVHQFQKRIVQPIGKNWNKEGLYRNKIKPKTVVKLGSIIEPINKSTLG